MTGKVKNAGKEVVADIACRIARYGRCNAVCRDIAPQTDNGTDKHKKAPEQDHGDFVGRNNIVDDVGKDVGINYIL